MQIKQYILIVAFFFALLPSVAQEWVVPLSNNPALSENQLRTSRLKAGLVADNLSLPFFDDFSGSLSPYPNPKNWIDNFVFINDQYPVNPLSIGVATFDALDQNGTIYSEASSIPFIADKLTSRPININSTDTGVYLSFFYQPQGNGFYPKTSDSIMVDFYAPISKKWWNVWKTPGTKLQPFKIAMIPVMGDSFLVKGFQFRFRNKASIPDNTAVPGKMGNVDHWNIDYVKLDANRNANDTTYRDVSFSKPLKSLLKKYESIPWKQFQIAFKNVMKSEIEITYRNNDTIGHKPDRYFQIKDMYYPNKVAFYSGNRNIDPQQEFTFSTNLEYPFFTDATDSALFEVKSFLETDPYDYKENDTVRYLQRFSNYSAYDDGSPEWGYGPFGDGTNNWMVANKFTSYITDTLSAIQLFFNSTDGEITKTYLFRLAVWEASNTGPGTIIYTKEPDNPKDFGKYATYTLDTAIVLKGDFYIGWKQVSTDFLNVGLDLNNDSKEMLFVNNGISWARSDTNAFKSGALMIRPVFGKKGLISDIKQIEGNSIRVYPNPTRGILKLDGFENNDKPVYAMVMDITSKVLLKSEVFSGEINLERLPNGIYLIALNSEEKILYKGKIIVQH